MECLLDTRAFLLQQLSYDWYGDRLGLIKG